MSSTQEATTTGSDADVLLAAVDELRAIAGGLDLPLEVADVDGSRRTRDQLVAQLDDYVLPRIRRLDAPLVAVVGGSTGAGKSTLVNSLVGGQVSRAGVLRPTTRSPVLVHHPDDAEWFTSPRVLPSLARLTGDDAEPSRETTDRRITSLRLVAAEALPAGLALLDAPDIDSVVDANRELAAQLLAAGDLWVFVTTAARYADAVPWHLLRTSVERGTAVAVVLDRVPPEAMAEVRTDLATMLRANGLATAPLFTIAEGVTVDGLLPALRRRPAALVAGRARDEHPGAPGRRPPDARWRARLAGRAASRAGGRRRRPGGGRRDAARGGPQGLRGG